MQNTRYDYFEYIAILILMFIPLNSIGYALRFFIVVVLIVKNMYEHNCSIKIPGQHRKLFVLILILSLIPFIVGINEDVFNYQMCIKEFVRLVFMLMVFLVTSRVRIDFKFVYSSTVVVLLINFAVQVIQRFRIFDINTFLQIVYTNGAPIKSTHLILATYEGILFRSGSIYINPNVYMVFLCMCVCVLLTELVNTNSMKTYIYLGILFISAMLAGSRTSLVVMLVVSVVYYLSVLHFKVERKHLFIVSLGLVIVIATFLLLATRMDELLEKYRFLDIYGGLFDSFFVKCKLLIYYLNNAKLLYLLIGGIGSELSQMMTDSDYGYLIQYYGLVNAVVIYYLFIIKGYHGQDDPFVMMRRMAKISVMLISLTTGALLCMPMITFIFLIINTIIECENDEIKTISEEKYFC